MSQFVHISLATPKLPESVDFYRRFLGVNPIKERPGYAKFELSEPGLNLTLNQTSAAPTPGAHHLGIQVETSEQVWSYRDRVESQGLASRAEEDVDCCYAIQDKFWVKDPDGVEWEVFTVKGEGALQTSTVSADAAGCCAPDCCD